MWTIIKYKKKNLSMLKSDLSNKIGEDIKFYMPKIQLQKTNKNKICVRESFLLGDYVLCYHEKFSNKNIINILKYCRGLKYFLDQYSVYQNEIEDFIKNCKKHENKFGYLKQSFFQFKKNKKFKFISGPFTDLIFNIINENKLTLKVLMGNFSVTVSKEEYLFRPV